MSESHDEPEVNESDPTTSDDEQEPEEVEDGDDTDDGEHMPDGISALLDVGSEE